MLKQLNIEYMTLASQLKTISSALFGYSYRKISEVKMYAGLRIHFTTTT